MVWLKGLEHIPGENEESRNIARNLMLVGGGLVCGEIKCIRA
jgi:hypothetical protein